MNINKKGIRIGEVVFIEQAWEDDSGHLHDETARVLGFYSNGALRLKFESPMINSFLQNTKYFIEDVEKIDNIKN